MTTTLLIGLNAMMCVLAAGAVAAGALIASRLRPQSRNDEGRAWWRGPRFT